MSRKALEGVKILDFGWVLAAPLATKQMAMYGATVVRVESAAHPDNVRTYHPNAGGIRGVNRCGAFAAYNNDKMSLALDMRKPKALEIVKKLVAWADIVVENFSPSNMERRGLGWEELKKINPDVIMLRISMQGQTGPRAHIPGFGGAFQSQAGITELSGWPDREPVLNPIAFTDQIVPWYAAITAIAALEHRDRTGQGLYMDLGQYESTLNFLAPSALDYTANHRLWTRAGNRSSRACPHGVYRCQGDDRWAAIAVMGHEEWLGFIQAIGQPAWAGTSKFSTFLARKKNEDELDALIESWTASRTPEEVTRILQANGVAAGVVATNRDLHGDAQLKHRNHFVRLDHQEMGNCAYDDSSFRLSATPGSIQKPAPCLGEHTEYVCTTILGMSDREFLELSEEGLFQ